MKRSKKQHAMSSEDAELMARLQALPRPRWMDALDNYKTHTQRMNEFYREIDKASAELSADDAELLARLEALPDPPWLTPMQAFKTHAERMRAWYRELDKYSKPLIWRALPKERLEELAAECSACVGKCEYPYHHKTKKEWPDKRRDEVQRIAAARGDAFPHLEQAS